MCHGQLEAPPSSTTTSHLHSLHTNEVPLQKLFRFRRRVCRTPRVSHNTMKNVEKHQNCRREYLGVEPSLPDSSHVKIPHPLIPTRMARVPLRATDLPIGVVGDVVSVLL